MNVDTNIWQSNADLEDSFFQAFRSADIGVTKVGLDGEWLRMNSKLCEWTGYTEEELIGKKFRDITHPDDVDADLTNMKKVIEKKLPINILEKRYLCKDGSILWVHLTAALIRNINEEPLYFIVLIEDISQRKESEVALIKSLQDIIEMKGQLEEAKEQAEAANKKKSQFLANMSHELRTPLGGMINCAEMLHHGFGGSLTDKQKEYANHIIISGRHLLDVVNEILDLSKVEAGKLVLFYETINLEPFFADLIPIVQDMGRDKNIRFSFSVDKNIGTIEADQTRLKQIFFNLINNAVKFNKEKGEIKLQVSKSKDKKWLVCKVQDTGIGIPRDELSNVFSEFYQVDDSYARQSEGAGLGLALTKRFVKLHGGEITVESEEGTGSTFTFKLPFSPAYIQNSNVISSAGHS